MSGKGKNGADSNRGGEIVKILKDGYWERTAVVKRADGGLVVRKEIKGEADSRPWARRSLVREIRFLQNVPGPAAEFFPGVLSSWGGDEDSGVVGYEMPYYEGWVDMGSLVRSGSLDAERGRVLERQVADAVVGCLHEVRGPDGELSRHVPEVMQLACDELSGRPGFGALVNGGTARIDGERVPGIRKSIGDLGGSGLYRRLDAAPQVLLHGDLILENVLVPDPEGGGESGGIVLIDPVSVAGVTVGHPAFDLVKYESYARGDLYAIRSGAVVGAEISRGEYRLSFSDSEEVARFRASGLGAEFRTRFLRKYGELDPNVMRLLDGYFSLAMAINTTGSQPLTRALMAAKVLAAIGG